MEDKFNFENKDNFNLLLIKTNTILQFDYNDKNYLDNIINMDIYENVLFNSDNFTDLLYDKLISKYKKEVLLKELELFTQVILEIPDYIYEIIYIKNLIDKDEESNNNLLNELGTLLNTNGENIYGDIILMKTYIPSLSDSILIKDTFKEDIKIILNSRVNINIVIFEDNEWSNIYIKGKIEDYANNFFEDKYYKCEIPFLLHNINVWYEICEGCSLLTCGKIIEKPVYKCLWFTKIYESPEKTYNGNLSLDEVKKIIKISYKIEFPFKVKDEWIKDEFDKYRRKIVKNKFKILDLVYNELY
jgi:hypothetical protein